MAKIQCVPNFSEGRDPATIAAIVTAVAATAGVEVIDVSPDPDHHRVVVTFVGDPQAVVAGAVAGAREAVARIDLTRHLGQHPRMGAIDVLPFVPLSGITLEECVAAARSAGARLAAELELPVYFYEAAATRPERQALPAVRGGGFEAIRERELRDEDAPDLGPARAHPTAGAVAVGARPRLLAFNVNLNTARIEVAKEIAARVREGGGGLAGVRALGLELAGRGCVQVSMNVTRPDRVPLYRVLELVRAEAARFGVTVAGTELIGTCLLEDLVEVGRYYLGMPQLSARQLVDVVAGVVELPPFGMERKDR